MISLWLLVVMRGLPLITISTGPTVSAHDAPPTGVGAGVGGSVGPVGHALHDNGQYTMY